jgi:hypothetical protein
LTLEGPRPDEAGPRVDPAGEPVEDAWPETDETTEGTRSGEGRVLDRGAIYGAMVGLGMAVTIAISFGLIVAVQPLVFIAAPLAGLTIGWYANHKSLRWRPRWRLFSNAAFAGAVTGFSLALMYVAFRLLFIYADSGYRPETMGGQVDCNNGPECTYFRLIEDEDRAQALIDEGVTDVDTYTSFVWQTTGEWMLQLTSLTLVGALVPAGWRAWRPAPTVEEIEAQIAAVGS